MSKLSFVQASKGRMADECSDRIPSGARGCPLDTEGTPPSHTNSDPVPLLLVTLTDSGQASPRGGVGAGRTPGQNAPALTRRIVLCQCCPAGRAELGGPRLPRRARAGRTLPVSSPTTATRLSPRLTAASQLPGGLLRPRLRLAWSL